VGKIESTYLSLIFSNVSQSMQFIFPVHQNENEDKDNDFDFSPKIFCGSHSCPVAYSLILLAKITLD
jgi:hypothetical protein